MSQLDTGKNGIPVDPTLRCDTCGKVSAEVKRVVLDSGYNRANARPLYNCPDCYEAKRHQRDAAGSGTH